MFFRKRNSEIIKNEYESTLISFRYLLISVQNKDKKIHKILIVINNTN